MLDRLAYMFQGVLCILYSIPGLLRYEYSIASGIGVIILVCYDRDYALYYSVLSPDFKPWMGPGECHVGSRSHRQLFRDTLYEYCTGPCTRLHSSIEISTILVEILYKSQITSIIYSVQCTGNL